MIAEVYQVDFSTQSLSVLNKAKEKLLIRNSLGHFMSRVAKHNFLIVRKLATSKPAV